MLRRAASASASAAVDIGFGAVEHSVIASYARRAFAPAVDLDLGAITYRIDTRGRLAPVVEADQTFAIRSMLANRAGAATGAVTTAAVDVGLVAVRETVVAGWPLARGAELRWTTAVVEAKPGIAIRVLPALLEDFARPAVGAPTIDVGLVAVPAIVSAAGLLGRRRA